MYRYLEKNKVKIFALQRKRKNSTYIDAMLKKRNRDTER